MARSFATTVHTPSKCPGREAPSHFEASSGTATRVAAGSGQPGYIASTLGANTRCPPDAAIASTSDSKVRG